ncbi:hypothetical protein [Spiroplasma sp. ChiS]|uniref:hypothetical protein n=1 Tax=Spiroplasma sp. ChiS TaxID=2099885 RepID=UPI0018F672C0|nr:hypothetical protein [Spiroplasma sp. ChiS]
MARRGFRSYFRSNRKSKMTLINFFWAYVFPVVGVVFVLCGILGHFGYITISK